METANDWRRPGRVVIGTLTGLAAIAGSVSPAFAQTEPDEYVEGDPDPTVNHQEEPVPAEDQSTDNPEDSTEGSGSSGFISHSQTDSGFRVTIDVQDNWHSKSGIGTVRTFFLDDGYGSAIKYLNNARSAGAETVSITSQFTCSGASISLGFSGKNISVNGSSTSKTGSWKTSRANYSSVKQVYSGFKCDASIVTPGKYTRRAIGEASYKNIDFRVSNSWSKWF